jgi:hypothetical protein
LTKDKGQRTKDLIFTLVAEALEATKDKGQKTKDERQRTKDLIFTLVAEALEATKDNGD